MSFSNHESEPADDIFDRMALDSSPDCSTRSMGRQGQVRTTVRETLVGPVKQRKRNLPQENKERRQGHKSPKGHSLYFEGQNKEINLNVINVSNRILKDEEKSLLAKGLHFCLNRHFDLFGTILDVNKFSHSLTLKKHYFESPLDSTEVPSDDFETGESPPSPIMFTEVCALQDLIDLAGDSSPPPPLIPLMCIITYRLNLDLIFIQWHREERTWTSSRKWWRVI